MKTLKITLSFLILLPVYSQAQDLIIYHTGNDVEAQVLKITSEEIVYKKHSNPSGPEYSEPISNVFMIKYENGDKDVFNTDVQKITQSPKEATQDASVVNVPTGTSIELYLTKTISSKDLKSGAIVPFGVKNDLRSQNGNVIISANTLVNGTVVRAEKARGGGKEGSLDIMINHIRAVDGQLIPVFLNMNNEGVDKRSESFWVGMLLFWPALFAKGGEAEIKAGSVMFVQTTQNIAIAINGKNQVISTPTNTTFPSVVSYSQPTIISPPAIDECGDKPKAPTTFNNPQYKSTKKYKEYKKMLKLWEDCKKGN